MVLVRQVSFAELACETVTVTQTECNRQIWGDGSEWAGYEHKPRHADGLLLVCSDIEACFTVGGKVRFTAGKGDAVYIPRGSFYKTFFKNGGNGTDIYTANFLLHDANGNELKLSDDLILLSGATSHTCADTASDLADAFLFSGSNLKKQALMLRLLENLVSEFESCSKGYHTIKKGVKLLKDEWNKNEKIERYAKACGISESSFYSIFKEWSGKSPIDYRNGIRVTAAKSMLENSNLQISEIAFAVGFDDPYYFSRFFKKETGVSPRAFRNG